jgi:hypothetical protein
MKQQQRSADGSLSFQSTEDRDKRRIIEDRAEL